MMTKGQNLIKEKRRSNLGEKDIVGLHLGMEGKNEREKIGIFL